MGENMTFRMSNLIRAFAITIFLGALAVTALWSFGIIGGGPDPDDPAELVRAANGSLEAVRHRSADDRRPASFDAVLQPLDRLLAKSRDLIRSDAYDPVANYDELRSLANPVITIADEADTLARNETGMWTKDYRFTAQKAEACQYLANALWEKINRELPAADSFTGDGTVQYPVAEMQELRRILDAGVLADPENTELLYARGILNRAEGLFAPAARDLEEAVQFKADFAGAWNTLGLVRIALKEFDRAEEALERARAIALAEAEKLGLEPGAEHIAILYNLAMFHDNLAAFYSRENRMTPTVEYQRLLARHAEEAGKYWREFLQREPADSPDAENARARLQVLGQ